MFEYIKGLITEIESNYIVVENNDIGYKIYTSNPYSYEININTKVYLYNHIREDEHSLYGFKSIDEKNLFLKLISVKGLGCKMALPLLASDINDINKAIDNEDLLYLKKFPKIGDKLARQIILDLKGKLSINIKEENKFDDLIDTLVSLGYKKNDIKKILPNIDSKQAIENQIKEAFKLMLK